MEIFKEKDLSSIRFIREELKELLLTFNKISIEPDRNYKEPKFLSNLPIHWEINQIYSILISTARRNLLPSVFIIVVDENAEIKDGFILSNEYIKSKKEKNGYLSFKFLDLNKPEDKNLILDIQNDILKYKRISKRIKEHFNDIYSILNIKTLIVPMNYNFLIESLNLPLANLNLLEFFLSLLDLRNNAPNSPFINYILSYLIEGNEIKQYYDKFLNTFSYYDIKQWSLIWGTLLDELMVNLIILSDSRIIFGCRVIVENKKITINPLPVHVYKPTIRDDISLKEIAQEIYEKTGLRTLICEEEDIIGLIIKSFIKQHNFLDLIIKIFEWSESSIWYPDSVLNSFLKIFGFTLGNDISQFSEGFKIVIKNFENILIFTYKIDRKNEKNSYQTFVHLTIEDDEAKIKLIDSRPYHHFLEKRDLDPLMRLREIKTNIESDLRIKFKACLGFDINILAESLSARNIESLLKMKNIAHQLPFVASLGALFAGMKAMNVEEAIERKDSLLITSEQEPETLTEEPLKFKEYFDAFLKKGILFISDEELSMAKIRLPFYSKDGFLGLDMDLIRKNIEKK